MSNDHWGLEPAFNIMFTFFWIGVVTVLGVGAFSIYLLIHFLIRLF